MVRQWTLFMLMLQQHLTQARQDTLRSRPQLHLQPPVLESLAGVTAALLRSTG